MIGDFNLCLGGQGFHHQGHRFGRADICTIAATLAVQGVHLHSEPEYIHALALTLDGGKGVGSPCHLLFRGHNGDDGGMGADIGALVALDAVPGNPFGNVDGNAALLILGRPLFHHTVHGEGGDRKLVTAQGVDLTADIVHKISGRFHF